LQLVVFGFLLIAMVSRGKAAHVDLCGGFFDGSSSSHGLLPLKKSCHLGFFEIVVFPVTS